MKLIIDIPDEEYERINTGKWEGNPLADYIDNGIPYEERPIGYWKRGREISRTMRGNNIEHIEYANFTCSECGLFLEHLLYHFDGSPFYKFCPECGAKMEGEI